MFNTSKDQLFTLVKSLSKSEKRNFKLYANRLQSGTDTKFMQLFEAMDKLETYDDDALLNKLPDIRKRQLPNLKRHLYKQILISLRLVYINKNIDIQIREQLDFARILYGKGMYMQALKLLERIKQIALEHHQDILHLEILDFQKLIEARHITRSRTVKNKMENLLEEADKRSFITYATSRLSNFNIQVHGWYIEKGHVANAAEAETVQRFFNQYLPDDFPLESLTFFEKVNLFQAYMWLYYILLDLERGTAYARQWVEIFEENPQMQEKDPDLYMRGLYYLLTFYFFQENRSRFAEVLERFETFEREKREQFNSNSSMIAFVYLYLSKLNYYFLTGEFKRGLQLVPEIERRTRLFADHTDPHRILLFDYKIAYLHFGRGDFGAALERLNHIIHLQSGHLREDLHFNARLLHLICHYELGNFDLLEYLISALQRMFDRSPDLGQLHRATLQFLQVLLRTPISEQRKCFLRFKHEAEQYAASPYEKKTALYLNVPGWIESHLTQQPLQRLHGLSPGR